jgi:hypothetical protein
LTCSSRLSSFTAWCGERERIGPRCCAAHKQADSNNFEIFCRMVSNRVGRWVQRIMVRDAMNPGSHIGRQTSLQGCRGRSFAPSAGTACRRCRFLF